MIKLIRNDTLEGLMVCGSLFLASGVAWNAFIHGRVYWSAGFALLFGMIAYLGTPKPSKRHV